MRRTTTKLRDFLSRLARPAHRVESQLVVCGRCQADFVNPVSWHELSETHWWIRLRCGECGFVREVEVTNENAQRFEHELDRGVKQIAAAFVRLDRKRMIADSDAITAALERDLIDPGDFCR
jgi:uncharacterized Zn finger protein